MKNLLSLKSFAAIFFIASSSVSSAGLMVTEVIGKVEIVGKGLVKTLAQIPDGLRLELLAGSTLAVVDLASGREFILQGKNTYLTSAAGPTTADGKPVPAKTQVASNLKDVRVWTGKLSQATLVMRGAPTDRLPVLLFPLRTAVISVLPQLSWEPVKAATSYQLEIIKLDGSLVWKTVTTQTTVSVPESHSLQPEEKYSWRVAAIGAEGKLSDSASRFTVASKESIDNLNLLLPLDDSSFSRKVLVATQLQEVGAVQQAKDMWKALSLEKPEDEVLADLAK